MSRKMIPVLLLVFFISALSHSFFASHMGSAQAAESMAVTSAKVTFNPKKKDTFVLKGTTGSLSLTGATSVIFEAGPFNQEIALNAFTKSKEKYKFKAAAGQAGLTNLVLDMAKGQFSAKVQKVFLAGFTNPLPISLKAGTTAECTMPQFSVNGSKWAFSGSGNPQYGCLISQPPQATPKGLFVNKATDVKVQAQVPTHTDLNENSIGLFRVDSSLNILSGPLCGFSDNGSIINGDQTAGDRIFSCLANLQEGTAGKMFFVVGAVLGGKMTYSPSFSLDVVTPYTEQEAQQTMTAQESAGQAWLDNLTKYGDSKKARTETVKAVKALEGVKEAGVSSDGASIWIEFTSGIKGGLLLSQEEETSASPVVERIEPSVRRTADIPLYVPPTSCTQKSDTAEGTSPAEAVGNCKVLIWDLYGEYEDDVDISAFTSNPSMRFLITKEYRSLKDDLTDDGCQVDSLRDIWQNGTVLIKTESRRGAVQPLFKTNENVTLQKYAQEKYMLEVLTGCLEARHNPYSGETKFYFTPNFISTLEGQFNKRSIVYVEAAYSSELASAFLSKGVHTFFGYSGGGMNTWYLANENRNKLFTSMVKDGMDTGEAYAALPILSFGTSLFLKYSSSTTEIGYEGDCFPVWSESDYPAAAHYPLLNGYYNGEDFHWFFYQVNMTGSDMLLILTDIRSYQNASAAEKWFNNNYNFFKNPSKYEIISEGEKELVVVEWTGSQDPYGVSWHIHAMTLHKNSFILISTGTCLAGNCSDEPSPYTQNQLDQVMQLLNNARALVDTKCKALCSGN